MSLFWRNGSTTCQQTNKKKRERHTHCQWMIHCDCCAYVLYGLYVCMCWTTTLLWKCSRWFVLQSNHEGLHSACFDDVTVHANMTSQQEHCKAICLTASWMIYVLYDCVCVPTDFVYIVVRVLILPFGTFNDLISSFLSVFAVNLLTTREWPHIQLPRTDAGILRRYATRSQKGLFTARGVWPRSRHPPAYQSVCTWPACHHSPTATVDRLQQLTGRRYNSEQATSHGQKDQRLIVPGGLAIAHPSSSRLLSCTAVRRNRLQDSFRACL